MVLKIMRAVFLMCVFYSFATTTMIYAMPENIRAEKQLTWVESYYPPSGMNHTQLYSEMQNLIQRERKLPFIDLGPLLFYTGNYIVDTLLNFVTAVPSMASYLFNIIFQVFDIDPFIQSQLQVATFSVLTFAYLLIVLNAIIGIRTGRLIE